MAGKFEIYKDKRGEFRFRPKASNGQNILVSEGYSARSGATNGIESVLKNAHDDARYERNESRSGGIRVYPEGGEPPVHRQQSIL